MTRRLYALAFTCPVCRQRRTHLSFCRWQPRPISRATWTGIALGLVACFWLGTWLVAGWRGLAIAVAVGILVDLLIFGLLSREQVEAPDETPEVDERQELFRLTHCHRCGACICHEHEALSDDTFEQMRPVCETCAERVQAA